MTEQGLWRKSSYSGGENNACVEIKHDLTAIRDSKNLDGPVLYGDIRALIAAIQSESGERLA
jgi:hypothetical protein